MRELAASSRQPLIISQFWTGRYTQWGAPKQARKAKKIEYRLNESLSAGACLINQTMFFGGTNFGDTAGRGIGGDRAFVTTSYDYDAPLSEGLKKTPKALALGLWARWAKGLAPALLGSEVVKEDHPVIPAEVSVIARVSGDSKIYFLHNETKDTLNGKIQVDDAIPFSMPPGEQRVYAYNIPLTPNLSVRASSHPSTTSTWAPARWWCSGASPARRSSSTARGTLDVTERSNENILLEHERKGFMLSAEIGNRPQKLLAKILFEQGKREIIFLIVTRALAEQTSFDEERKKLVLGSAEVDFDHKSAGMAPGLPDPDHHHRERLRRAVRHRGAAEPKSVKVVVTGVFGEDLLLKKLLSRKDWKEAAAGKDLAEYGFSNSRAWYKVIFNAREKGKRTMIIPDLEDQFAVFLNDAYMGL